MTRATLGDVPSLNDVVQRHTDLSEADLDWLHALIADWQLLADLSFADLVLWVPDRDGEGYRAVAQMRPTTGPTAYVEDLVGTYLVKGRRPLIDTAYTEGVIRREGDPEWWDDVPVRVEAIPVRHDGRVIAVIGRHTNLIAVRTPSRLELSYLECGSQLATLITEGRFPHTTRTDMGRRGAPRVGDGLVRMDADGLALYASPNAVSVYRRLGLAADLVGQHLGKATAALAPPPGARDEPLEDVLGGRQHIRTEIEGNGTVMTLRIIPLDPGGQHVGALALCRDVTEVRRRERELLTKDATIREIHHRVKNNLQTVAALLRLQSRRIASAEGRAALDEAVRRVGSIAIVHETLSQTVDDTVAFDDVADRLLGMVAEVAATTSDVRATRSGTFGILAAETATPLAMTLTEVLQNAVEHGLGRRGGAVLLTAERSDGRLLLTVEDDGVGLPPGFDATTTGNLGLQIVRSLVVGELSGTLEIGPRTGGGTRVVLDLPVKADSPR
ncbi:Two-component sensor histidine kinase, contains HisKA and HATPase domains [Jiangella alkaliphila]|uniref:histidine kinase n=1 Tax=Jiangella alkaliphila TaxID=419479 RepID=A0A1H2JI56_9ACTN|nr:PAS domain-containing sensor histidine kinase [Jiangella alkaliphila]SDU56102.1 Two-component sensor histidine kinase, contains HisKA and HATPase domains [Jiangella alkaliphila]